MPDRSQDSHISIRIPSAIVDRLAAVEKAVSADSDVNATGVTLGRSAIVRLAVVRGLEVLERKYKLTPPRERRG
ncbi:MAG: hypothetical protein JNM10_05120 [Planctomycetia bacterium]|nr:hypothetical protein [Planctomycetia bacterium]